MSKSKLESTKRLLTLLKTAIKGDVTKHVLYDYIMTYDSFLGSDQILLEKMFERLAISHNPERYDTIQISDELEETDIRKIFYYELFYFLKYALPNLKTLGLPSVAELLRMEEEDEFKPYFYKMYPETTYRPDHFKYRLSHIADFAQGRYQTDD